MLSSYERFTILLGYVFKDRSEHGHFKVEPTLRLRQMKVQIADLTEVEVKSIKELLNVYATGVGRSAALSSRPTDSVQMLYRS